MTGFIPVPPDPWVPTATDSETKLFPAATMDALDEHNDGRYATTEQGEKADSAYQLPEAGVPKTDLAAAVQTSLGKADTAVQPADVGTMAAQDAGDYLTAAETNAAFARVDTPAGLTPEGHRRAAFVASNGNDAQYAATSLTNAHVRVPVRVPVGTTRWRLRLRNAAIFGPVNTGSLSVSGAWIGAANLLAGWLPDGTFSAAPNRALPAFTTPSDGGEYVSAWVDDPALQFDARVLHMVSIGWTKANTTQIVRGPATAWRSDSAADASAATPSGGGWDGCPFRFVVEYEFAGTQRVYVALGDSLTEGAYAGLVTDVWHQRVSALRGVPIINLGAFGATAANWADIEAQYEWLSTLTVDGALMQNGVNDTISRDLDAYQWSVSTIIGKLRATGIRDVYFNTIAPKGATGTVEDRRKAYNAWLRTYPFGARGVFEVEEALASKTAANELDARWKGGDAVHWGAEGNARAASIIMLNP